MSCSKAFCLILSFRFHLALLLLLLELVPLPVASFGPLSLSSSLSSAVPPSLLDGTSARILKLQIIRPQSTFILPASVVSDVESMSTSTSSMSSSRAVAGAVTVTESISTTTPVDQRTERGDDEEEPVPTTLREAFDAFLLGQHHGPRLVIAAIAGLAVWRSHLGPVEAVDGLIFATLVVFWWLQEHVLHKHALHSRWDWPGKEIHREHHAKPYSHVSIDPAPLMLGWLGCAALILRGTLPPQLALSATLGYAAAGLFYEWAHYVVHTKVRFPRGSYWYRMKHHHIRHHMVDSNYWLGFSVPAVDDVFGTNPSLHQWKKEQRDGEE